MQLKKSFVKMFKKTLFLEPQEKKKKHTFRNSRENIMKVAYFYVRNTNTFVLNLRKSVRSLSLKRS